MQAYLYKADTGENECCGDEVALDSTLEPNCQVELDVANNQVVVMVQAVGTVQCPAMQLGCLQLQFSQQELEGMLALLK